MGRGGGWGGEDGLGGGGEIYMGDWVGGILLRGGGGGLNMFWEDCWWEVVDEWWWFGILWE